MMTDVLKHAMECAAQQSEAAIALAISDMLDAGSA